MSAHADKTLHWKISGNINDIDTFPYLFLKNVIFRHGFVDEFFANFVHEFKYEIRTNSREFVRIFCKKNWLCDKWPVLYPYFCHSSLM